MKIPHTIPLFILRAYAQKLTPEEYEGRILRSEDPTWDTNLKPTLASLCLDLLIKDYSFYVRLTNELNRLGALAHDNAFAQWEMNLANYKKRKISFERKLLQLEIDETRRAHDGGPDDSDDSDDDELKQSKIATQPIEISDQFEEFVPILPVLDRLNDTDRVYVIEELDFEEIPLQISVATIPDEYYWERCCNERWPESEPYDHENSWKKMFIERHLRNCIEEFHPLNGDLAILHGEIDLCALFVHALVIHSLIPACFGLEPPKPAVVFNADEHFVSSADDAGFEESEYIQEARAHRIEQAKLAKEREESGELVEDAAAADDDEEDTKPSDNSHVNFSIILPKLTQLKKLSIIYGMAELGSEWDPRYIEFTWKDTENLAKALALSPTIEIFELNKSNMSDEQTKLLVREGLILMPHLKVLNLSYNKLGDAGTTAIARLISDPDSRVVHTLHTLSLARNQIRNPGMEALAYAITLNKHLYFLDLRLNYIRNNGGSALAHALVKNQSIQILNLSANYIGARTCGVFRKMMRHNITLSQLDLSSNDLGSEGGEALVNGVKDSKTIFKMDVRMTNMGADLEYEIQSQVRNNRKLYCYHNLLEDDDVYPPENESNIQLTEENDEEGEEGDEEVKPPENKSGDSDDSGSQESITRVQSIVQL